MEQVLNEQDFAQGFNNALLLAEFRPDLLNDIVQSVNPNNMYFDGFFAGKEQWEHEKSNQQMQELQQLREQDRDNELDFEREL